MKPHLRKVEGEWFCGEVLKPLRDRMMVGRYGATPKEAFDKWNADSSTQPRFAKNIKRYATYLLNSSGVL